MSVHNHRFYATNEVTSGVLQSGVTIAKGDIVLQNSSGYPYPAASETWDTDLATTQANAKAKFLGIALGSGIAGDRIRVATDGEFVFPITTGTPAVGGPVGIAKASGNNLISTGVATVATASTMAIGRVTGQVSTNVIVRIRSAIMAHV
ncbi:MAG: hypothetical protein KF805_12490 [Phycisphaeraceae bacterium]|nr:hypothetical protein [Phycisphaeraceae bacterium]